MSDSFNRNLVILIFIGSYMYMNFVSLQIRTRSGWSNLTCNPINLFSNSLFQSQADANRDFERCIVNLSSATTTNLFKKQKKEQQDVLTQLSGIQTEYSELTDDVKGYVTDASNITLEYSEQINKLQDAQENANALNTNTSGAVQSYLTNLKEIMNNITEFFQKK